MGKEGRKKENPFSSVFLPWLMKSGMPIVRQHNLENVCERAWSASIREWDPPSLVYWFPALPSYWMSFHVAAQKK